MPRRPTQLRGPKDRDARNKPTAKKPGKGLDALSIAENEFPLKAKIRRSRLGDDDDYFKRKRDDDDEPDNKRRRTDEDDNGGGGGSDSEGREWKIGVDSDNDSELDSDEAMGSSDDEMFEGFSFRGSSTTKAKPKQKPAKKEKQPRPISLSEDVDESDQDMDDEDGEDNDDDDDDDLGEDAVDLATAWDMNTAAEDEEAREAAAKAKKAAAEGDGEEFGSEDEEEDEDDEESSDEELSGSEDEDAGMSMVFRNYKTLSIRWKQMLQVNPRGKQVPRKNKTSQRSTGWHRHGN